MCKDCLFVLRPDTGTHATDSGADMTNYKGCINCQKLTLLSAIVIDDDVDEDSDDRELRFQHVCSLCNHVVSEHFYSYTCDDDEQVYTMECFLCGRGQQTVVFEELFSQIKKSTLNDQITDANGIPQSKLPVDENGNVIQDKYIDTHVVLDQDKLQRFQPAQPIHQNDDDGDDEWN